MLFRPRAPAGLAAERLRAAGCAIVFTGAPELSAAYALDQASLERLGAIARDLAAGLPLPPGADVFVHTDTSGTPRPLDPGRVRTLYLALRDHGIALDQYAAGQLPAPPGTPVTLD